MLRYNILQVARPARAAAWIIGADRWPERTWRDLEAQFGKSVAALEPVTPAAATVAPPTLGFEAPKHPPPDPGDLAEDKTDPQQPLDGVT